MSKLSLVQLAESKLGKKIVRTQPLTQGDISEAILITVDTSESYVVKDGVAPQVEADMLQFMAQHEIDVPKVIYADDNILIMEAIKETNCLSTEAWQNLAFTLTKLHSVHGDAYGWKSNYAFSKVKVVNSFNSNWVDFWRDSRLVCYLDKLPLQVYPKIEYIIKHLEDFIPQKPKASLLHGDLWSGNIIARNNQPFLIDPASYFGDHEVDIAMLNFFGNPSNYFYNNYALLEPGWQERTPIYQLFPAIVHYILFGDYYLSMIQALFDRLKI